MTMLSVDDNIVQVDCNLSLGYHDDNTEASIRLTEGGSISVEFGDDAPRETDFGTSWESIEGTDSEGRLVEVSSAVIRKLTNGRLDELDIISAAIEENADYAPGDDVKVAIEFDVVCFQPFIPPQNRIDEETRETMLTHSDIDEIELKEYTYIEDNNLEIYGVPFVNTTDRTEIVEGGQVIRTAKIRTEQSINGDLKHHMDTAERAVSKLLEVSQLVQETVPRHIRGKVVTIDGVPIVETDNHYEVLQGSGGASAGGRFAPFPNKQVFGELPEYLNQAYTNYTDEMRETYQLPQVLQRYVYAREHNLPVVTRLLTTCSAIEILALWHAREDSISESTEAKINHVVDKLDIETEDLAEQVVPNVDELDAPAYFWRRARNYVSHGDPNVSHRELVLTQEATLIVLKRLLRNQILGSEDESFDQLYDMQMRGLVEFGD